MLLWSKTCLLFDRNVAGTWVYEYFFVVDLVGHKGRHERREVKLEVEDVAWEGIGDFERGEMEVAEMGDVVDVVEINPDVLNPRGIGRNQGRHVVVIVVVFNVVVNVHHFET